MLLLNTGSLEDQLVKLKAMQKETEQYRANLEELGRFHKSALEAMVYDNSLTPYTMEVTLH